MDRMGLEEGEVIQHSMVSKSIERAQKKVEENNFGTRKRLLEYDDVMNQQREVVYKKRRHALHGERMSIDVLNMIYDTCETITNQLHETKDYNTFQLDLMRHLATENTISEQEFKDLSVDVITEKVFKNCYQTYKKSQKILPSRHILLLRIFTIINLLNMKI